MTLQRLREVLGDTLILDEVVKILSTTNNTLLANRILIDFDLVEDESEEEASV